MEPPTTSVPPEVLGPLRVLLPDSLRSTPAPVMGPVKATPVPVGVVRVPLALMEASPRRMRAVPAMVTVPAELTFPSELSMVPVKVALTVMSGRVETAVGAKVPPSKVAVLPCTKALASVTVVVMVEGPPPEEATDDARAAGVAAKM